MAKPPTHLYEEEQERTEEDGPVSLGTWIGAAVFFISIIMLVALVVVLLMKKP